MLALCTVDYRHAQYLAERLDRAFTRTLLANRGGCVADLKAILKEQLALTLRADLEQHLASRPGASVYGLTPDDDQTTGVDHDLDLIDAMISDAHERLVTRDTRLVMPLAIELAKRHGLPEDQVAELAVGLLQVELQAMQTGKQRLLHGVVAPMSLDATPIVPTRVVESTGPLLSEVLPQFIERMTSGADGWREHTLIQNNGTFRMFAEVCGDRPVGSYTKRDLSDFSDVLRGLHMRSNPRHLAVFPQCFHNCFHIPQLCRVVV